MYPTKQSKTLLLAGVLMMGSGVFVSCTDDNYDLGDLDKTVGVSNVNLTVPTNSTSEIKLSDIIELNDGDCVRMEENGDYVFHQESNSIAPTKVSIDPITLKSPVINDFDLTIKMPEKPESFDQNNPLLSMLPPVELKDSKEIQTFSFSKAMPEDVVDLKKVEIVPNEVTLDVYFSNLKDIVSEINEVTLELPDFMKISEIKGVKAERNGNKFTLKNVPTTSLRLTLVVTGVNFDGKGLKIENGNIVMSGSVKMGINVQISLSNPAIWNNFGKTVKIGSHLSIDNFTINKAQGYFKPSINMDELGSTSINSVPDFLKEEGTCIDLYNPQIYIRLDNTIAVGGEIEGKIYAYKDGQLLPGTPVEVKGITIEPNASTVVCICRDKNAPRTSECTEVVEVPNLTNLIRTIPDKIEFADVKAKADDKRLTTIELGHDYEIAPAYWVDAPVALAEDARVIYVETEDGWNENFEDLDLTDGTSVEITADVENNLPAFCEIQLVPIDCQNNEISNSELSVSITPEIAANTKSQLKVLVEQKKEKALQKLNGVKIRLVIKAKGNNGEVAPGITLNGNTHTLKLTNVKITVKGGAIIDCN